MDIQTAQFGPYTLIYTLPDVPKAKRNGTVVMTVKLGNDVIVRGDRPDYYRDMSTIDEKDFVRLVSAVVEADDYMENMSEYLQEVEDSSRELNEEIFALEDKCEIAMENLEEYLTVAHLD